MDWHGFFILLITTPEQRHYRKRGSTYFIFIYFKTLSKMATDKSSTGSRSNGGKSSSTSRSESFDSKSGKSIVKTTPDKTTKSRSSLPDRDRDHDHEH